MNSYAAIKITKSSDLLDTTPEVSASKFSLPRITALCLLLIYGTVRFGYASQLDQWNAYGSYIFELFFVMIAATYYRQNWQLGFTLKREIINYGIPALGIGAFVFWFSQRLNLPMPFDFNSKELIVMLLIGGPILEEFLFRMALWEPLKQWLPKEKSWPLITTSSLIFAYGHFHAYWYVEGPLRHFILYQTAYALLLGIVLGFRRIKTNSLGATALIHSLFNLGFYLAHFL